jgi:ubiquinone/menaquinone biosynthesis C-methylase UbiE
MSEPGHTADAFSAFEQAGWEAGRASPYHERMGAITARPIPALLDAAGVTRGSAVLDVATGPGYAAAQAAERGAEVVAVDRSHEMLELAASLHPAVEFRYADANALPFADATFDAVVSNLLMPHVTDLPAVVGEQVRVLRPGGRVALTTWDPEPPTFLSAMLETLQAVGAAPPAEIPAGPSFFQYAADDELAALLAGAGLADPAVETLRFTHAIADARTFVDDMTAGTVRMGVLIASQPADVRAAIRSGFAERIAPWRTASGFELCFSFKLGHARLDSNQQPLRS